MILKINKWISKNIFIDENFSSLKKFETGQSNPTYLLKSNDKSLVIRSKPLGRLLPGAHRIDREYRVMSALEKSQVPVPKMYGFCNDIKIIGSEFYIMEYLDGIHFFDPSLPNCSVKQRDLIYRDKIEILGELALLDIKKSGLENFGKPQGYIERQINLWIKQYRCSQTKNIKSMEYLIENIPKYIPHEIDKLPDCLLHGDFRVDNMIFRSKEYPEKVAGLLDWELSTLSKPFIDLSYWALMLRFEKNWPIGGLGYSRKMLKDLGIPAEEKILEIYLNKTGFDKPKYWNYLLAFNCFRFAGVLQGIAKRVVDGNNAGDNGFDVGEQAEPVAILGSKILKEYL